MQDLVVGDRRARNNLIEIWNGFEWVVQTKAMLPQANSDVCGEEGIKRARQRTFEENDELMRLLSDS